MKRMGSWIAGAVVLGLWCSLQPALGQAPEKNADSRMDQKQIIRQMRDLDTKARKCRSDKNYECAGARSETILSLYRQLSSDQQQDSTVLSLRWKSLTRLGYYSEAKRLFAGASEPLCQEWNPDMEELKASYGGLILRSTDALLNDHTLDVTSVEIQSKPGTASGFPFDLVQARAARAIRSALQERDLQQDAFILPAGAQTMRIRLGRESSLNYPTAELLLDIDVLPDTGSVGSTAEAFVPLSPRKKPWAVVGGIAAVLCTPFLMAK